MGPCTLRTLWIGLMRVVHTPEYEGLLGISSCTRPPLRDGLYLSISTYNYRTLSKDEIIYHLLQEVGKTLCDTLGVCEHAGGRS